MANKPVKTPRKKANGYKFPKALPKGEILQDTMKKEWQLGPSIGKGGFGEVYSAAEAGAKNSDFPYVIKIEPKENGPLYVELHCYMRIGKPETIDEWIKSKKLKSLGMPKFFGFGSHEFQKEAYRFIVLERFGQCIATLFKQHKSFPLSTVLQLSHQIIDVLEYIHSLGYVHGDIKGDNLLLGRNKASENQVYLVDFGLASKCSIKTEFKPDPKKAHDGTIEYTSRDAHHGVPTMRGDLEILAYNMVHWLSSTLPWLNEIQDPKVVQQLKEKNMKKIPEFLKSCFSKEKPPTSLGKFLNYIASLKFNATPDYAFCRKLFKDELTKIKFSLTSKMVFSNNNSKENKKTTSKSKIALQKSESENEESEDEEDKDEEPEYFSDSEPERAAKLQSKRKLRSTRRKLLSKDSFSDSEVSPSPPKKTRRKLIKPVDSPQFLKSLALKNSYVVRHPDIIKAEQNKK